MVSNWKSNADSNILTSTKAPTFWVTFRYKAARIPCAKCAPANISTIDKPIGTGSSPSFPVSQVNAVKDCNNKSCPGLSAKGPLVP